jgi:cytidylate kinase
MKNEGNKKLTENKEKIIVAIDGPAGSGKSSSAKIASEKLGYIYIDTGAMYRAITLAWLRLELPLDEANAPKVLAQSEVELKITDEGQRTFLNGEDVSDDIRSTEVTTAVSPVSAMAIIRDKMVAQQREMGKAGGVIMDGRDIGTVVFPNAELKIFFVADPAQRAKRRYNELIAKGQSCDLDEILQQIIARDKYDSERENSPLKQADDALLIDNTTMTLEEQADKIVELTQNLIS